MILPSAALTVKLWLGGDSESSLYESTSWRSWSVAWIFPRTLPEKTSLAVVMKISRGTAEGGYWLCSMMLIFMKVEEERGG